MAASYEFRRDPGAAVADPWRGAAPADYGAAVAAPARHGAAPVVPACQPSRRSAEQEREDGLASLVAAPAGLRPWMSWSRRAGWPWRAACSAPTMSPKPRGTPGGFGLR